MMFVFQLVESKSNLFIYLFIYFLSIGQVAHSRFKDLSCLYHLIKARFATQLLN